VKTGAGRLVGGQFRHRPGRALGLAAGLLVSALSFSLLTSATRTAQLRTVGTVQSNFRSAYDILVRPLSSVSPLERRQGVVRNNFETGVFGGITLRQWRNILAIPQVRAAAPVAYVGWVSMTVGLTLPLKGDITPDQLYRQRFTYVANGLSRYPGNADQYFYLASRRGGCDGFLVYPPPRTTPFTDTSSLACYSPGGPNPANESIDSGVGLAFPLLLAAVDPEQENNLLPLDRALVSGKPLSGLSAASRGEFGPVIPVIGSTRTYQDENVTFTLERVRRPAGQSWPALLRDPSPPDPGAGPNRPYRLVTTLPGDAVRRQTYAAGKLYPSLLRQLEAPPGSPSNRPAFSVYWTVSPVDYSATGGALQPHPVANRGDVWRDPENITGYPVVDVAPDNQDVQFRRLRAVRAVPNTKFASNGDMLVAAAELRLQGRFDPARLPGFSALSRVPLESYLPPLAQPANAATSRFLRGRPLTPDGNIGGYLAQPPFLLTTLTAAQPLLDPRNFRSEDGKPLPNATAPISVIRVAVTGVQGADRRSLQRVRQVAQLISSRTGLAVDITAGSSPAPQVITLPAGNYGRPVLTLREGWAKKGVAVGIVQAVDRKSVLLFLLILVVCVIFAGNATAAAIGQRRRELATLSCLGWSPSSLFALTMAEVVAIGLAAGVTGSALSVPLAALLSIRLTVARAFLVVPVAVAVVLAAGLLPAARAARADPLDATRSATSEARVARTPRTLATLALVNLFRRANRTIAAALALAVGVAGFTILVAITTRFKGQVLGSLLGDVVAVQVRAVDYIAVGVMMLLGAASVADVLYLNVRERASELATLHAIGWDDRAVNHLVGYEAALVGVLGAVAGAGIGIVAVMLLTGRLTAALPAALLGTSAGMLLAVSSAMPVAAGIRRLPVLELLAAEQ